jgi:hypothetical protein
MATQANSKKPIIPKAYSIDLREQSVRAVEERMSVDDRLFMRAEMDGSVSSYRKCAAETSRGLSSESFVAAYSVATGTD